MCRSGRLLKRLKGKTETKTGVAPARLYDHQASAGPGMPLARLQQQHPHGWRHTAHVRDRLDAHLPVRPQSAQCAMSGNLAVSVHQHCSSSATLQCWKRLSEAHLAGSETELCTLLDACTRQQSLSRGCAACVRPTASIAASHNPCKFPAFLACSARPCCNLAFTLVGSKSYGLAAGTDGSPDGTARCPVRACQQQTGAAALPAVSARPGQG